MKIPVSLDVQLMCVCLYTYTTFIMDVLGNTIIIVADVLKTKLLQALRYYNVNILCNMYIAYRVTTIKH